MTRMFQRSHTGLVLVGLATLTLSGCMFGGVNRRLTIRSEPPGALVLLEGQEVGRTPMAIDFTYYGTREVTLIKDGFETLTVLQKIPTPWYQYVGIDFIAENANPFKIRDQHNFTYQLKPQVIVGNKELQERAEALRSEVQLSPD